MSDKSTTIDISGVSYYIDKGIRPCILRAWNNYHGQLKYDIPIPHFQNTRECFYRFVPSTHGTLAIPSHAFHTVIFYNWLSAIECTTLFVVKDAHVYCVKYEQTAKAWIAYDWPRLHVYPTLSHLQESLFQTRYFILLYSLTKLPSLRQCIRSWRPKPTPYYTALHAALLAAIA